MAQAAIAVEITGFVNGIVLTVIGKFFEEVEMLASDAIRIIEGWIAGVNLQLAHHKTEAVMMSNCKAALEAKLPRCQKIMPNDYGLSSSKRRLRASVAMSVLRYGVPIRTSAIGVIAVCSYMNTISRG